MGRLSLEVRKDQEMAFEWYINDVIFEFVELSLEGLSSKEDNKSQDVKEVSVVLETGRVYFAWSEYSMHEEEEWHVK